MIQYHLLNQVKILAPRWHDRVILPRCDKFVEGHNVITIEHNNYPSMYIMTKTKASSYPVEVKKSGFGDYDVYVIPLDDLQTLQEYIKYKDTAEKAVTLFGW